MDGKPLTSNLIYARAFVNHGNRPVAALIYSDGQLGTLHDDTRPADKNGAITLGNYRGGDGTRSDPSTLMAFANYRKWVDSGKTTKLASLDILPNAVR